MFGRTLEGGDFNSDPSFTLRGVRAQCVCVRGGGKGDRKGEGLESSLGILRISDDDLLDHRNIITKGPSLVSSTKSRLYLSREGGE